MGREVAAAIGSLVLSIGGWFIGQVELPAIPSLPNGVTSILSQMGGLGLAVWLVYHHTTVTIPSMQRMHSEERTASQHSFEKILDEKRTEYFREIERQREQFSDLINRTTCKYRSE